MLGGLAKHDAASVHRMLGKQWAGSIMLSMARAGLEASHVAQQYRARMEAWAGGVARRDSRQARSRLASSVSTRDESLSLA